MQQITKFRTWDKVLGKWVDPSMVYLVGDGTLRGWGDKPLERERFILCFYTGLKDKNGVDIYKGDIATRVGGGLLGDPRKIMYQGEVVFEPITGCHIKHFKTNYENKKYEVRSNMFNSSELEVIGNIYENPELLEAKS